MKFYIVFFIFSIASIIFIFYVGSIDATYYHEHYLELDFAPLIPLWYYIVGFFILISINFLLFILALKNDTRRI